MTFYNGTEGEEDKILRLSDAFESEAMEPDIEVKVRLINISYGRSPELMKACRPLAEYAWLVEEIRKNRRKLDIEKAVDKAIDEMPKEYEIRMFLIGHRAEVKDMCITEYNEAETMAMIKEEGREEGRSQTVIDLVCRKLRKGKSSKVIAEELEEDLDLIRSLCLTAELFAPDYDSHKVYEAWRDKK